MRPNYQPLSSREAIDLKQLILEGLTSYEIAEKMRRPRSTICGAASRRGWRIGVSRPLRHIPAVSELETQPVVPEQLGPKVHNPQRRKIAKGLRAVMTIERHECRWPVGDPKQSDFHFCQAVVDKEGEVYCAKHREKSRNQTTLAPR